MDLLVGFLLVTLSLAALIQKEAAPRPRILRVKCLSLEDCTGDTDVTEKPIDLIKVYSEKELIREFEKIASNLVPEKDWSARIGAMQRVEGFVLGEDMSQKRG